MIYRQGDIVLVPVKSMPKGAIFLTRGFSQRGETGLAHTIDAAEVFVTSTGRQLLHLPVAAEMKHPQHPTVAIPPNVYVVQRPRTYTPHGTRVMWD